VCGRELNAEGFRNLYTKELCKKLLQTGKDWVNSISLKNKIKNKRKHRRIL